MHPYFDVPRPHLFGHRGASGEAPENTLESFLRAWDQGVPFLETDCHATRDGEIVLFHDADLERTTDRSGPIAALSLSDLQTVDAGYRFTPDAGETYPYRGRGVRVPRLADLLAALPDARINLEIKPVAPAVVDAVLAIVRAADAEERVLLAAAETAGMDAILARKPATAIGSSLGDIVAFYEALRDDTLDAFEPRGHALQIPPTAFGEDLIAPERVAAAHQVGLLVDVWTINDPAEMRRILEVGVDGVMSDLPARLIEVAGSLSSGDTPSGQARS